MRLRREDGPDRQIATREELERALEDLGRDGDDFAVLARDDGAFAQAAGTRTKGFVCEVKEGEAHLQSRRENLSREEVVALLALWLEGDERWRKKIEWGTFDGEGWRPLYQRHAAFVLAVALVLAGAGEWVRQRAAGVAANLRRTEGDVVALHRAKALDGSTKPFATARFWHDGQLLQAVDASWPGAAVGARVWVWYDARDPARTAALRPPAPRGPLFVGLWVAAALVGLFALKMSRDIARRERREAAQGGGGGGAAEGAEGPRRRMVR